MVRYRDSIGGNLRALLNMWDIPLLVAAAMVAYLGLAHLAVADLRLMPKRRERMVCMAELLEARTATGAGDVFVLGSSVVIEGIDAEVIAAHADNGREVFNLSWTGAAPHQWALAIPKIREANPSRVILCMDLFGLFGPHHTPEDLLAIAGWWQYVDEADRPWAQKTLTPEAWAVLRRPRWQHLLTFRSLPPAALDAYVRETSRKSLRYDGHAENFSSPWVRTVAVSPAVQARSVDALVTRLQNRTLYDAGRTLDMLASIIEHLRDAGIEVTLVLPPLHPDVRSGLPDSLLEDCSTALAELARARGASFVDHTSLLEAEHFSDAVHPFTQGRELWSAAIGRHLRARE